MLSLNYIFKILAFMPIYDINDTDLPTTIIIDEKTGDVKKVSVTSSGSLGKKIVNILYKTFVIMVISWYALYCISISIRDKNMSPILANLYSMLFAVQYYFGYSYYNSDIYKHIVTKYNVFSTHHAKVSTVIMSITLIMASVTTSLIGSGVNMSIYSIIYNSSKDDVGKCFFLIFMFIDRFYSYGILMTNMVIFIIIMFIHKGNIRSFYHTLEHKISSDDDIKIETIGFDFNAVKYEYSTTIESMNGIFSSVTIIGITGLFFIALDVSDNVGVLQYIHAGMFAVIEILYFYAITVVKNTIGNISKFVTTNKFAQRYFVTNDTMNLNSEGLNDMVTIIVINTQDINQRERWKALKDLLFEQWDSFNVLGFDIDDTTIIQRGFFMFIAIIFAIDLKETLSL